MKKVIIAVLIATAASFAFAKGDGKKAVKFSSSTLSSKIKCNKLAEKAFGSDFKKITPQEELTIWYQDKDNYIYFYENGKRGENRNIEGHAIINGHKECYSAFVTRFENSTSDEYIYLGTNDRAVNVSSHLEEAFSYSTNENLPSKKEWKDILTEQRENLHKNIDEKMIPSIN